MHAVIPPNLQRRQHGRSVGKQRQDLSLRPFEMCYATPTERQLSIVAATHLGGRTPGTPVTNIQQISAPVNAFNSRHAVH
jgi:hypothetical protein